MRPGTAGPRPSRKPRTKPTRSRRPGTAPKGDPDLSEPVSTLAEVALALARSAGDRPFLTFHDVETGERTELGHATFENWTAKTANLLTADLGLGPGARVAVALGGHWTSAVVALAAWRAGLVLDLSAGRRADVAVVREDLTAPDADEVFVVGRAIGARLTRPAAGEPFASEVLGQADEFGAVRVEAGATAVLAAADGELRLSHAALLEAGRSVASSRGIAEGERLLCTMAADGLDGLVAGLAAALSAGGALVLAPGAEAAAAAIAATERCSHIVASGEGLRAAQSAAPGSGR